MTRIALLLLIALPALLQPAVAQSPKAEPRERLVMTLATGKVVIELRPDLAPKHVERMKLLAREGFYEGIAFHRVVDGYVAQAGDPTGTGRYTSKYGYLPAEFSDYSYKRGTVGMARTSDPNTGDSQFFICFNDESCQKLNGKYTVFGQVVEGMELIDKLTRVQPPSTPQEVKPLPPENKILRMEVAGAK